MLDKRMWLGVVLLSLLSLPVQAERISAKSVNLCEVGKAQSPINLEEYLSTDLSPLAMAYKKTALDVVNTGHTIQMYYEPGSVLSVGEQRYALSQVEFYTPSEHYLNGAPYPMELQFVHVSADGVLGIVSVMVKLGAHNRVLQGLWDNIPMEGKRKTVKTVMLSAQDLMPEDKGYYHYKGSLSVAPCSEGVQWYILKEPIQVSTKQLIKFQKMFPRNARMIQPLNGRVVKGSR